MTERRKWSEDARIPNQNVEATIALVEGSAEPVDSLEVLQVEWHQSCGTAKVADFVVELLKSTYSPSQRDDMGTGRGERQGGGRTDSA